MKVELAPTRRRSRSIMEAHPRLKNPSQMFLRQWDEEVQALPDVWGRAISHNEHSLAAPFAGSQHQDAHCSIFASVVPAQNG
jgi:hypothetical protein